ncbi:hypothetical protein MMRN_p1060 (plasmid) [Mycobacterium marinum]|nr:hypothetical protein MMRN_p1060 [Mycobacterium marinum]
MGPCTLGGRRGLHGRIRGCGFGGGDGHWRIAFGFGQAVSHGIVKCRSEIAATSKTLSGILSKGAGKQGIGGGELGTRVAGQR